MRCEKLSFSCKGRWHLARDRGNKHFLWSYIAAECNPVTDMFAVKLCNLKLLGRIILVGRYSIFKHQGQWHFSEPTLFLCSMSQNLLLLRPFTSICVLLILSNNIRHRAWRQSLHLHINGIDQWIVLADCLFSLGV